MNKITLDGLGYTSLQAAMLTTLLVQGPEMRGTLIGQHANLKKTSMRDMLDTLPQRPQR